MDDVQDRYEQVLPPREVQLVHNLLHGALDVLQCRRIALGLRAERSTSQNLAKNGGCTFSDAM
jgi:hypothetical protein